MRLANNIFLNKDLFLHSLQVILSWSLEISSGPCVACLLCKERRVDSLDNLFISAAIGCEVTRTIDTCRQGTALSEKLHHPPVHIYNSNNSLINKLLKEIPLTGREIYDLINLPATFLICYLNKFDDAIIKLQKAKNLLKKNNIESYINFKEAMRILRKIKYN